MWTVYEVVMNDEGIFNEVVFGYTNDPISAAELKDRGYTVYDSDTLEPLPA